MAGNRQRTCKTASRVSACAVTCAPSSLASSASMSASPSPLLEETPAAEIIRLIISFSISMGPILAGAREANAPTRETAVRTSTLPLPDSVGWMTVERRLAHEVVLSAGASATNCAANHFRISQTNKDIENTYPKRRLCAFEWQVLNWSEAVLELSWIAFADLPCSSRTRRNG